MLDFYLSCDDQPTSLSQLRLIGGIEEKEFEEAQDADIIESHLDYYGKFRLSNELVRRKIAQL